MSPERYNALVERLEADAAANPRALRRRVFGLVALGYLYVAMVVFVLLAAIAGVIWAAALTHAGGAVAKIVIVLLVLLWLVLKSLWVRSAPPQGQRLAVGEAPALARRVEEIRAALGAPRATEVLVTTDFNASVTQVPRLGIFGWPRTYLTLGLPLMCALTPRQLDAVLAHEFAHLSGAHPKRGLWVYRMSHTWRQLLANIGAQPAGRFAFGWFARWYAPRLQAYGFVMARRDEYVADADAASLCGPSAMAEALVALELRGRALAEHGWPEIWRGAITCPFPPEQSWSAVASVARADMPPARQEAWLGHALRRRALDDDTHPALADRLRALGVPANGDALLPTVETSAAHVYLGPAADTLLATLDEQWRVEVAEGWLERHTDLQELRARADELLRRDRESPLETAEVWELARAMSQLESPEASIPWLRRAATAMPADASPHYLLGSVLLGQGDDDGVAALRHAMALEADLAGPSLELMRQHHASRGDRDAVAAVEAEQHALGELMEAAALERADVGRKDTLDPSGLGDDARAGIAEAAGDHAFVERVWVTRKRVRVSAGRPMYVVLVKPRPLRLRGPRMKPRQIAEEMLQRIQHLTEGDMLVITLSGELRWLQKKAEAVSGALVFPAEGAASR